MKIYIICLKIKMQFKHRNNGNRNGTCFTSTECEEKNGRAEGNCASGFGICCVFTKETCGEKVNQNSTYIR